MDNLSKEILEGINKLSNEVTEIKKGMNTLSNEVTEIKKTQIEMKEDIKKLDTKVDQGFETLNKKMDSVYDQTADLTEFKTSTSDNINKVAHDVKFIKRKVQDTEEDVFFIQDHLKIIK